jgi:hypothetical protein
VITVAVRRARLGEHPLLAAPVAGDPQEPTRKGGKRFGHLFEEYSADDVGRLPEYADQLEIIDEKLLTAPPEARSDEPADMDSTIYYRLPASLKRRIEHSASTQNLSVNAWMLR